MDLWGGGRDVFNIVLANNARTFNATYIPALKP